MEILNTIQIIDHITTSGQPSEGEFNWIAHQGFRTVINLALTNASNALPGEDIIVTALGMTYIQIPLVWTSPKLAQFAQFTALLQACDKEKIWVHCALNKRVSVFLYLYCQYFLNIPEPECRATTHQIWSPDDVWQSFIEHVNQHFQTF